MRLGYYLSYHAAPPFATGFSARTCNLTAARFSATMAAARKRRRRPWKNSSPTKSGPKKSSAGGTTPGAAPGAQSNLLPGSRKTAGPTTAERHRTGSVKLRILCLLFWIFLLSAADGDPPPGPALCLGSAPRPPLCGRHRGQFSFPYSLVPLDGSWTIPCSHSPGWHFLCPGHARRRSRAPPWSFSHFRRVR